MTRYYRRADPLSREERNHFGVYLSACAASGIDPNSRSTRDGNYVVAKATNVCRPPKAGEWYISGAEPEAYRAPNDLSTSYFIATLVKVRKETIITLTEIES